MFQKSFYGTQITNMLKLQKASNSFAISLVVHAILLFGFLNITIKNTSMNFSKNVGQAKLAGRVSIQEIRQEIPKPPKVVSKPTKKKIIKRPIKKAIKKPVNASVGRVSQGQKIKLASYLTKVRNKIAQHKYKNRIADRLRLKGKVGLKFDLEYPNKIINIELLLPSKYKALNQSALESIKRVEEVPNFPNDLDLKSIPVTMNMVFE